MPQSVPPRLVSVREVARIRGRVNIELRLIMTSAPRNSFQDMMKLNSATVTMAGTVEGIYTQRSACTEVAPSTMAASSSSGGTALKLLRRM
jgi:hypothetical protein